MAARLCLITRWSHAFGIEQITSPLELLIVAGQLAEVWLRPVAVSLILPAYCTAVPYGKVFCGGTSPAHPRLISLFLHLCRRTAFFGKHCSS